MLTLIPTPIDDHSPLEQTALNLLKENCLLEKSLIVVEELKEGRRRWLRFGLPREVIDKFVQYNEHTHSEKAIELLKLMQSGHKVFIMSDCGLPAFCDPGRRLVELCHQHNIKVTSTPFYNSIALAVALSGFSHDKFMFEGFVSAKNELRQKELRNIMKNSYTSVLMDTPYRMKKLIDELKSIDAKREAFLAIELNKPNESLLRATLDKLSKRIEKEKKDFILILGPKNGKR